MSNHASFDEDWLVDKSSCLKFFIQETSDNIPSCDFNKVLRVTVLAILEPVRR